MVVIWDVFCVLQPLAHDSDNHPAFCRDGSPPGCPSTCPVRNCLADVALPTWDCKRHIYGTLVEYTWDDHNCIKSKGISGNYCHFFEYHSISFAVKYVLELRLVCEDWCFLFGFQLSCLLH